MPDNPESGPGKQDAGASKPVDNPEIEAIRAEMNNLKQQYGNLRSAYNQRDQEVRALREKAKAAVSQPQDYWGESDTSNQSMQHFQAMQERLSQQNQMLGLLQFRSENPDWQTYWPEIQTIINDPVEASRVASFDNSGQPDFNRSLTNALREVQLRKLRDAQKAAEAMKSKTVSEQERLKAQATISGVGASQDEEQIDVSKMTSDEMLEAGLVEQDSRSPIRPTGIKRHKG